jgi:hypothetical protein
MTSSRHDAVGWRIDPPRAARVRATSSPPSPSAPPARRHEGEGTDEAIRPRPDRRLDLFLGQAQTQRVNLLCSPDLAWCEALGPAFKAATGIDLEFQRLSSNDGLARLRAEAANPIFDAWFGGTGDPHLIAFREGLTEFYEPTVWGDIIQNLKDQVGGTYIPLYAGALGFVVNEGVLGGQADAQGLARPDRPHLQGPDRHARPQQLRHRVHDHRDAGPDLRRGRGLRDPRRPAPEHRPVHELGQRPRPRWPAAARSPSPSSSCTTASSSPPRASR